MNWNRLKNPASLIGFSIALLALVVHGAFGQLSSAQMHFFSGLSEVLGLTGAWFFNAGMAGGAPAGVAASAEDLARASHREDRIFGEDGGEPPKAA